MKVFNLREYINIAAYFASTNVKLVRCGGKTWQRDIDINKKHIEKQSQYIFNNKINDNNAIILQFKRK